jgi:hypothetical protein
MLAPFLFGAFERTRRGAQTPILSGRLDLVENQGARLVTTPVSADRALATAEPTLPGGRNGDIDLSCAFAHGIHR